MLSIEELEVRLTNRFNEAELLETLRRNMLPSVQDRLLIVPIHRVAELQHRAQQIEELLQRQSEVQQVRKGTARVHELSAFLALLAEDSIAQRYVPPSLGGFPAGVFALQGVIMTPSF